MTGGLWSLGGVGPGHQLVDAGRRPTVDELGENVGGPVFDGENFAIRKNPYATIQSRLTETFLVPRKDFDRKIDSTSEFQEKRPEVLIDAVEI